MRPCGGEVGSEGRQDMWLQFLKGRVPEVFKAVSRHSPVINCILTLGVILRELSAWYPGELPYYPRELSSCYPGVVLLYPGELYACYSREDTLLSMGVICLLFRGVILLSMGLVCMLSRGGTLLSRGLSACYPREVKLLSTVTWSYTVDYEWILCHQRGIPSTCFLLQALASSGFEPEKWWLAGWKRSIHFGF